MIEITRSVLLGIFLVIAGAGMAEFPVPRWINIVGGLCAIVAGLMFLSVLR